MQNHYVTFGQTHTHSINGRTLDKDTVAVFKAPSWETGRAIALDYFGTKFSTDYHGDAWTEDNLKWFPKGYVQL